MTDLCLQLRLAVLRERYPDQEACHQDVEDVRQAKNGHGSAGGREVIADLLLAHAEFPKQALRRRRPVECHGPALPLVTLEGQIVLTTMVGRHQDRADIERMTESAGTT